MLLLLSKYKMKIVPVVELGEGKIENIFAQSAVIHMLAECAALQWFESWGTKRSILKHTSIFGIGSYIFLRHFC